MSKHTNGSQGKRQKVSDGSLGGYAEGLAATEISEVAMPAASWGEGTGA